MNKFLLLPFSLLIVFLFAFVKTENGSKKEVICTANAPKPIGPYSQAIKVGNTLYVSGQIGLKIDGSVDTISIESECLQAMKNVKAVVEASGMSMDDIVKSSLYVKDLKHFSKINEIYGTFFTKNPPARETMQVSALPKSMHFEISVIAVK